MGKLEGSGGDTEEIGVRVSRGVKESDFCRTWSPEYSSGVSEACCLDSAEGSRESAVPPLPPPPGPLAASLGQRVPDALGIPSRRWIWVSWGRPHPGAPDFPGWLSLSAVAVKVCVLVGIRELLAAPMEILLLTANVRRGCFHGNTGH